MGTLYLVATPIGNLEDLSPRAIRTLGEVELIAAEDTRHTRKLLSHFEISTPLTSYFEHNKLSKLDGVLEVLHRALHLASSVRRQGPRSFLLSFLPFSCLVVSCIFSQHIGRWGGVW